MAEELPQKIKEFLEGAPRPIRERVESAIKGGAKIRIVEIDTPDKDKKPQASDCLCEYEEKEKKDVPFGDILKTILDAVSKKPTTHEVLLMAVTTAIKRDPKCSECIARATANGKLYAPCLEGRSTAGVLLKGALELSKNHPIAEKVKMITKVFGTDPEGVIKMIQEHLAAKD